MRWYVRTADGKAMGPLEGEAVRLALTQGVKLIEVAPEDSQKWVPVESVPAFEVAAGSVRAPANTAAAAVQPRPTKPRRKSSGLTGAAVVGCAIVAISVWRAIPRPTEATEAPSASTTTATDPAVAAPWPAPPKDPIYEIRRLQSLGEAVEYARPSMADTSGGKLSDGTYLLAAWSLGRMTFSDVGVAADETTIPLTMKDPDEARGKRLCIGGTVIEIAVETTQYGKTYSGILMTDGMNLVRFLTVGSTGSLVAQRWAHLCGVVTGKYEYPNSGGGTGHAVQLVGMFDLPENRSRATGATAKKTAPVPDCQSTCRNRFPGGEDETNCELKCLGVRPEDVGRVH